MPCCELFLSHRFIHFHLKFFVLRLFAPNRGQDRALSFGYDDMGVYGLRLAESPASPDALEHLLE
jgi:hypothetical protein